MLYTVVVSNLSNCWHSVERFPIQVKLVDGKDEIEYDMLRRCSKRSIKRERIPFPKFSMLAQLEYFGLVK